MIAMIITSLLAALFSLVFWSFEQLRTEQTPWPVWPAAATSAVLALTALKAEQGLVIVAAAATLATYPSAVVASFMMTAVAYSAVQHRLV